MWWTLLLLVCLSQPWATFGAGDGSDNCTKASKRSGDAVPCKNTVPEKRHTIGLARESIQFSPLPPAKTSVHVKDPGFNPYTHIKDFLRFVQPKPLPFDMLQDYMKGNASTMDLVKKVLEMEAGFLTLVLFAIILSLVVPVMSIGLCSPRQRPTPSCAPNCKRRTLVCMLHLVLVLLLLGSGGMLWTNEECSRGLGQVGETLTAAVQDTAGLWSAILQQLQHLLTRSFEDALLPFIEDLNGTRGSKIMTRWLMSPIGSNLELFEERESHEMLTRPRTKIIHLQRSMFTPQ